MRIGPAVEGGEGEMEKFIVRMERQARNFEHELQH